MTTASRARWPIIIFIIVATISVISFKQTKALEDVNS